VAGSELGCRTVLKFGAPSEGSAGRLRGLAAVEVLEIRACMAQPPDRDEVMGREKPITAGRYLWRWRRSGAGNRPPSRDAPTPAAF
jgi:hypothetical protein